ncbi:hypothetical protein KIN20_002219 [Parelaphostrongylus tenuis]|uniref:Uncharacterized protein n=1 Tax=Parelaphostrongylus tenuis TaxID=148309 RepID=A0AAD5MDV8_PARTN|nr:hypothetical protein KIN20_002219 [Parelaphostrongylus tenuis]
MMHSNACERPEHSALSGLKQLSKLFRSILDKEVKSSSERDRIKRDIATIVSNCLPLYLSGSDNSVYPLSVFVKHLSSLALLEMEENGRKLDKSQTSGKTWSFELTMSVSTQTL